MDQFESALKHLLTPEDESPTEAAAASDKEPAPADDAADEQKAKREAHNMRMRAAIKLQNK